MREVSSSPPILSRVRTELSTELTETSGLQTADWHRFHLSSALELIDWSQQRADIRDEFFSCK